MSGITTKLIHTGHYPEKAQGAIIPPIHLSSTFTFGNPDNYEYSRYGNPTRQALEETLAVLDNAPHALAFASGSAALAGVLGIVHENEEILFSPDVYGGTFRYITQVISRTGIKHHIVDFSDLEVVEQVLASRQQAGKPVKLVWLETPSNPLLKVIDIQKVADLAHEYGALLVVDNTFLTPVAQRPLDLGADIVVYSTTKYINGHSDSIGGSVVVKDAALYEDLKFLQNAFGAMLSPFDSWLTLRGLRTLELRLKEHSKNAQIIAEYLAGHEKVALVNYPSLFTGEAAEIVARQQRFYGGMVSFELVPDADIDKFIGGLRYFPLAESLGGVESLISRSAYMTHASVPADRRAAIGLSDNLLRLSVGIENIDDLLEDLAAALQSL